MSEEKRNGMDDVTTSLPDQELANSIPMLNVLYQELASLNPEERRMCELCMEGLSVSESARRMNMPRSTYSRHWGKVKAQLNEKLKAFTG